MKRTLLFVTAALAAIAFASCKGGEVNPENKPGDASKDPSSDAPAVKSNKCDIVTFTVLAGETHVEADVSPVEKKVVIPYYPEDADAMKSAKAEYTLSEGATISPDPAKEAMDFTREMKLTVTAQDGTTTKVFTVTSREYEVALKVQKVWDESKTLGQLRIVPSQLDYNTQLFAFAGTDKFVAPDLQVFDLEGKRVGVLNTDGIPSGWEPTSITNDSNGVVAACFAGGSDGTLDNVTEGGVYAWLDGYDKAPEELWYITESDTNPLFPIGGNRDFFELKVGGEFAGDFVATTYHFLEWNGPSGGELIGTYTDQAMFNAFIGKAGKVNEHVLAYSMHCAGDGNVWQALIPVSGSKNGLFVVCDSNTPPGGITYFVQQGIQMPSEDLPLYGTLTAEIVGEEGAQGAQCYGNYSCGDGFVVNFHGTPYLIAATSFWEGQYLTVQTLDPTDDPHWIMETTDVAYIDQNRVSAAAIVDPESDSVKILYATNRSGGEVNLFEMVREVL